MTRQVTAPEMMSPASLCKVISRLVEILKNENQLLATKKPASIAESLGEKTRLVAVYNQQMGLIKKNTGSYANYPKPDIDKLKLLSEEFYSVLDEHFRLLSNVKTVSEGIVKAVADEVQKKNQPVNGYTAAARANVIPHNRAASSSNNAISINQVI